MMQIDSVPLPPLPADLDAQVAAALAEDLGPGDVTAALVPATARAEAVIIARETAVVCGTRWVEAVFHQVGDGAVQVMWAVTDGQRCDAGETIARLSGPARNLLTGERTALNFLQTLSAAATEASRYVSALAGTDCRLLDTRKTLPGLRSAQKYAVRCGGGQNHRIGLFDGFLIKENHIAAAGGIAVAVARARLERASLAVEVEVETLDQLDEALAAGADIVLLDNFDLESLRAAVARTRDAPGRVQLEASGGVDLETVSAIAATGVDFISVGSVTKHVHAIDLSMRIVGGAPTQAD
jgi:nicotinate-nucleotide pyrophosphorylase (carboxylating)